MKIKITIIVFFLIVIALIIYFIRYEKPKIDKNNEKFKVDNLYQEKTTQNMNLIDKSLENYLAEAINSKTSNSFGILKGLAVTPQSIPNMTVQITSGNCVINNKKYDINEISPVSITASDAINPRIDLIYVNANGQVQYLQGTSSANPVCPVSPKGSLWLAQIYVPAKSTLIMPQNICDARVWADGKWIGVYNGHGGGYKYGIGIAECTSKEKWIGSSSKFLDWRNGLFDDGILSAPCIIQIDDLLYIYYSAANADKITIGLVICTKEFKIISRPERPVLSFGVSGSWDDTMVTRPFVMRTDSSDLNKKYAMYYGGRDSRGIQQTGLAYSPDGVKWTKFDGNPIMNVGTKGEWDSIWAYTEHIIKEGNTYYMVYSGYDGSNCRIGIATADNIEGPWIKVDYNPILSPRILAKKGLIADALPGDLIISVEDSSVFEVDEPCFLGYGTTYENVKIKSIPSSTTIELYEPIIGKYSTSDSSTLISAYNLSIGANQFEHEGNTWRIYATAWGAAAAYETTFIAEGVELDQMNYSFKKSPTMNYNTKIEDNWDHISQENLKYLFVKE